MPSSSGGASVTVNDMGEDSGPGGVPGDVLKMILEVLVGIASHSHTQRFQALLGLKGH